MSEAAAPVVALLVERGLTVATAESLTGGLVGAALTDVSGSSAAYLGGVVTYATPLKQRLLGVPAEVVEADGAVSAACAKAMAAGVRRLTGADVGVATTGVAGPEPQEGKPVGTVFIAAADADRVAVRGLVVEGDRDAIRSATVQQALDLVVELVRTAAPVVDNPPREV